jgi:hypothetical protein
VIVVDITGTNPYNISAGDEVRMFTRQSVLFSGEVGR